MEDGEAEDGEIEEGEAPMEEGETVVQLPNGESASVRSSLVRWGGSKRRQSSPLRSVGWRCQSFWEEETRCVPCACSAGNAAAGTALSSGRGELNAAVAGPGPGSAPGPGPGGLDYRGFVADVRRTLPEEVWRVMSPEFYVTFWSLDYHDVFVPSARCRTL
jgi:hypothetical protein